MSRSSAAAAVELDFFRLEKEAAAKPPPPSKLFDRRRSFRAISKINPELLKNVIATASASFASMENTSDLQAAPKPSSYLSSKEDQLLFSSMESTPLTVFYNGSVAVFDVNPLQAENILRLAHEGILGTSDSAHSIAVDKLSGDMPLHRRMSLQRFLLKRKERFTMAAPYAYPSNSAFGN
ncbi:PREDICTED: protein TIFY 9-like isoform X2 [Ipomoea nil]|uniref:protein TIFY 9-like isoform X2 n=1 Tax=Ipomoea nil TaxID=35883 RepID=UPI0009016A60|nr:PREDICTED: protein TIFY 9-like isoform X2 [Ipomoea nil]